MLINPIVKVQEPKMKGLTNFEKKESERERRKEKREKKIIIAYSQ